MKLKQINVDINSSLPTRKFFFRTSKLEDYEEILKLIRNECRDAQLYHKIK